MVPSTEFDARPLGLTGPEELARNIERESTAKAAGSEPEPRASAETVVLKAGAAVVV